MNAEGDRIGVSGLRVLAHIGVPDAERAEPQTLWIHLVLTPVDSFDDLGDDIRATVDYHSVALEVEALAAERPRRLIETLACEVAEHLLSRHRLREVEVVVEKRILPQTDCVTVRVVRRRGDG